MAEHQAGVSLPKAGKMRENVMSLGDKTASMF